MKRERQNNDILVLFLFISFVWNVAMTCWNRWWGNRGKNEMKVRQSGENNQMI